VSQYGLRKEATCCRFSGVADHGGFSPRELILRVMGGVAGQEGYCSDDLILRVVGWKSLVTRVEKAMGWNAKPSPSHMELPVCSGVPLQVS
jgi:hypothetical protein